MSVTPGFSHEQCATLPEPAHETGLESMGAVSRFKEFKLLMMRLAARKQTVTGQLFAH
jgi:hypothetical protein